MPTVTIRNLPEDVIRRLKDRAKRSNRSMEQEVRCILTAAAVSAPPTAEEVEEWAREARKWRSR